mmetsp:Transcript_42609/g.85510  ORF Transcript_42609/g.85510 Transcript_42609/m.85510 type:complete len:97 (+) Transcript_42609:91-381(+)
MLMQFADEGEILFPPCTMLHVREKARDRPPGSNHLIRQMTEAATKIASQLQHRTEEVVVTTTKVDTMAPYREHYVAERVFENDKDILCISVLPTFL